MRVVEGVSGRGLEAGLRTVVYKACAFTRASPEEQRVKEEQLCSFCFSPRCAHLPAPSGNMSQDAHPATDPTKMGIGRSIAVLTSGGDAQGKQRMISII